MMGVCFSKTKLAVKLLPNEYVKKSLDEKLVILNNEQARIILLIQSELNDEPNVISQREEELADRKSKLLDAIISGDSIEMLTNSIDLKVIKNNRLKELQNRLIGAKSSSLTIFNMKSQIDEAISQANEIEPEIKTELISNPNSIVLNLDKAVPVSDEKDPTYHTEIGPPIPNVNLIDDLMNEIRLKLETALAETLKKSISNQTLDQFPIQKTI
jgi:hypothetical protein